MSNRGTSDALWDEVVDRAGGMGPDELVSDESRCHDAIQRAHGWRLGVSTCRPVIDTL
jgi:hypothetical protein